MIAWAVDVGAHDVDGFLIDDNLPTEIRSFPFDAAAAAAAVADFSLMPN